MWPYGYGYGLGNFGYSLGNFGTTYPTVADVYWWGAPSGWTDLMLYDYNNNLVLDDNEIADIVYDNIFADPGIPVSDTNKITISVNNGVATLSGTVSNPRSKPLAYADAYWSSGIVDVMNNIQVKPHQNQGQQPQGQQNQMMQGNQGKMMGRGNRGR